MMGFKFQCTTNPYIIDTKTCVELYIVFYMYFTVTISCSPFYAKKCPKVFWIGITEALLSYWPPPCHFITAVYYTQSLWFMQNTLGLLVARKAFFILACTKHWKWKYQIWKKAEKKLLVRSDTQLFLSDFPNYPN